MTKAQWRRLVVRVIEDGCFFLFLVMCIWLVCSGVGLLFGIWGVGV